MTIIHDDKMKIGIIDADLLDNGTRHPNLALMKISGYYKEKGNSVELITSYDFPQIYDRIYISKVFTFTKIPDKILKYPNITIGGTGFFEDGGEDLPQEIEHHMPDYELYSDYIHMKLDAGLSINNYTDYLYYSIGFTTRGCFRKCSFCVNKKYDHAIKHSPITEFVDNDRPYIYLWDDNFLAYPGWEQILDELESTNKPFQFRQGLDIRLLTEGKARRLANTHYHGDFIFAFDHIEDREIIEKKLKIWRRHTNRTTKLYLLCAYDSQDIDDIVNLFERIKILMSYGCLPYIMRYESYKQSKFKGIYTEIARWCNQPQFFKKKSFRQFCEANQAARQKQSTLCSTYKTMVDFESKYPDIAKKYFDLRFDRENRYCISYGYGRKYATMRDCDTCYKEGLDWDHAFSSVDHKELIRSYFSQEVDLECLSNTPSNRCCELHDPRIISNWFCNLLLNKISWDDIFDAISHQIYPQEINQENIPQFSDILCSIDDVPYHIYGSREILSFSELGMRLGGKSKNKTAQQKYGENHAKFATLLDLVVITKIDGKYKIKPSMFGESYNLLSKEDKHRISAKLMFRIPIIQKLYIDAQSGFIYVEDYLKCLSTTTQVRRRSNIMSIIEYIKKISDKSSKIHSLSYNILSKRDHGDEN